MLGDISYDKATLQTESIDNDDDDSDYVVKKILLVEEILISSFCLSLIR